MKCPIPTFSFSSLRYGPLPEPRRPSCIPPRFFQLFPFITNSFYFPVHTSSYYFNFHLPCPRGLRLPGSAKLPTFVLRSDVRPACVGALVVQPSIKCSHKWL
ncbi:hypothetical protein I7I48_11803 [Histoplasma ohiense]|nr:hypothetical protein I7I48_11803 [Histoplasma ohiense (nom. inval.)]